MSRIAVVFTGGTISMRSSGAGNVPSLRAADLLSFVPGLDAIADVEPIDWGLVPASHLSFDQVLDVGRILDRELSRPEIDGAVVVQGTDVIEETAFAWDLLPLPAKPVVVVGAMRSASQEAYDGPENLRNAVAVAADSQMADQGVVVAMAGEIHGADDVRKTHTHAFATFQSPNAGRLGLVADGRVVLLRRRQPMRLPRIPERAALPVPLLTVVLDAVPIVDDGARGLVVAAAGGRKHAAWLPRGGATADRARRAGGADHEVPVRAADAGLRLSGRQLAVVGRRGGLLGDARCVQGSGCRGAGHGCWARRTGVGRRL